MKYLPLIAVLTPILTQLAKQIDWKPGGYPKAIAVILSALGVIVINYANGTLNDSAVVLGQIATVSAAAVGLYEFGRTAIRAALAVVKK